MDIVFLIIFLFLLAWFLFGFVTFIIDIKYSGYRSYRDVEDVFCMYFVFGPVGFVIILFFFIKDRSADKIEVIVDKIIKRVNKENK